MAEIVVRDRAGRVLLRENGARWRPEPLVAFSPSADQDGWESVPLPTLIDVEIADDCVPKFDAYLVEGAPALDVAFMGRRYVARVVGVQGTLMGGVASLTLRVVET